MRLESCMDFYNLRNWLSLKLTGTGTDLCNDLPHEAIN